MNQDPLRFIAEGINHDMEEAGPPLLAEWDVVGGLVHQFVADVFECYKCFQQGITDRETAMGEIEDEAKRLGAIFMGQDPAYQAMDWNSPTRLGSHIRADGTFSFKDTNDPGEAFFRWLSVQALKAATDLDNGYSPQEVGPKLQEVMRGAIRFLLGMGRGI